MFDCLVSSNAYCDFCGSSNLWPNFQNETSSSKIAVLPSCLWHICLAVVPLGWVILSIPFFVADLRKKRRKPLKPSATYILKALFSIGFIVCPVVQIILLNAIKDLLPGEILSNVALAVSGMLVFLMNEILRHCGGITSGTLTIYWTLCTAIFWFYFTTVYSATKWYTPPDSDAFDYQQTDSDIEENTFIIFTVQAALATISFILTWFPEELPEERHDGSYETPISWINSMSYSWLTELISVGYKKTKTGDKKGLDESDVKNVKARDTTVRKYAEFEVNWLLELKRVAAINRKKKTQKIQSPKLNNKNKVFDEKENEKKEEKSDIEMPSLYRAIWATFRHEMLVTAGWKLLNDILTFISPQLIKAVLSFITPAENGEYREPDWVGYLYATCMLIVAIMISVVLQRYWYHASRVGTHVKCVLTAAIYKKALRVNFTNQGATLGEVVNYMSVDTQKFHDTMSFINFLWSAPLQIIVALVFLYIEISWAAFMALVIFAIVAPLSMFVSSKMRVAIMKMMKEKDIRIKIMNELLSGIKVLKLYAWELPYMKKVNDIREREIKVIKENVLYQAVVILLWETTPYLVQFVCFAAYMSIGQLNAEIVYTSISLFNILRFPINILPMVSVSVISLRVANDRIVKFLYTEEIDTSIITRGSNDEKLAISVSKNDYDWKENGKTALRNFELDISHGALVGVVGPVGCGKSAMVSGLMGELYSDEGKIKLNGNLAYVPQQAWIQNMTLKDNILFGNELDERMYQKVIDVCCLQSDLDILEEGDQTEIGEKGINLSGGQKQRVSIARAVYADADIYIFDDPLSAVDAHVGREIFDRVLGPNGLLKDKTRILVTHSTQYLPDVDDIVVMDTGGEVIARGNLGMLKAMNDDRIETIISVKEREECDEKEKEQYEEKTAKTGNKSDGVLIKKEKAEEGGRSFGVFSSYMKAFGIGWVLLYIFWLLFHVVLDVFYNIWLATWVDAITWYEYVEQGDQLSDECISNIPSAQYEDTPPGLEVCDCGYGKNYTFPKKCYGDSFYLSIYGSIGIALGVLSFVKALAMMQGIVRSARKFHSEVLNGVMRSPMSFFDTTPSGRIVNRFGKDLDAIDMTIPGSIRQFLSCFFRVGSTFYILGRLNVWFLLIIPPMLILFVLIERYYIAANRQVKRIESTTRSPIYSSFGETISGAAVIRAYKVEDRFIQDNMDRVDHNLKFQYASLMCNRWLGMRLETFGNLIIFFVALFAVSTRGKEGISAADAGMALTYAQSVTVLLNFLIRITAELEVNLVAVERLAEYAELQPEAKWRIDNIKKQDGTWMKKGNVDFNSYSLRYREGLPLVLKKIQCAISDGQKIGIIGRTGAGKSSLTVGIFRLVEPAEGNIEIDVVDTNLIGLHDLREELTIIPQEPVLFSGTLRENLDPFSNFSDEKLWTAIEQSHLKSAVAGFSEKLEHQIHENGSNLSVGERQLVCLARALLRRSKILILDEATSAVDNNTDSLIQETIRREFADMTVLTIAHRLNTILDYDRVMVLDKGEIVEFDSPIELFRNVGGIFASMCKESNIHESDILKPKSTVSITDVTVESENVQEENSSDPLIRMEPESSSSSLTTSF